MIFIFKKSYISLALQAHNASFEVMRSKSWHDYFKRSVVKIELHISDYKFVLLPIF